MNEQDITRIEAYFKHTLNNAERLAFEEDVRNDTALKEIFEEYRDAIDVVDQQVENELRSKFAVWRKEESRSIKKHLALITSMAASIALVIGIFFFVQKSRPDSYTELAIDYYSLPESPEYSMGNEQAQWHEGIEFFNKKMYKQASAKWETITNTDNEVKFYLAHCYFNLKDYNRSMNLFIELAEGTSVYTYSAEWNSILCLLILGENTKAMSKLDKIISVKEHPYNKEAIELKMQLMKLNQNN